MFLYFVISVHGMIHHGDPLFWLNINESIKLVLYLFSAVPLFMGFMISFIIPFAIWETLVHLFTKYILSNDSNKK
jgi:hypothetical protein